MSEWIKCDKGNGDHSYRAVDGHCGWCSNMEAELAKDARIAALEARCRELEAQNAAKDERINRLKELRDDNAVLEEAVELSILAIDDWLHTFASELCNADDVARSWSRIKERGGTLAYIAEVQKSNRDALTPPETTVKPICATCDDWHDSGYYNHNFVPKPETAGKPSRMCPECHAVGGPDGVTICATCVSGWWEQGCEHCGSLEINPKCPACNGIER